MGLFSIFSRSKRQRRSSDDDNAGLSLNDPRHEFWYSTIDGMRRPGGQVVNATTAARVAAVYACCTAIAESIAMLPTTLIEATDDRTSELAKDHPLWKLLHDKPNSFMDSFEFFEAMQRQALDNGNAYASVLRSRAGEIGELIPLDPTRMQVRVEADSETAPQRLVYIYRQPNGTAKVYKPEDIFHFKPHSKDGLIGRSPIQVAADTIGFSLALLEHGNRLFENGAFQSGFIQAPHAFKDDELRDNFMASFKKYFGAKNAGKVALLEQGVTFKEASMTGQQAQFLESKEFSVVEIARLYRMPPVMIQAMDKGMAFASVEQLCIMFVQFTIQPWITRWERAIKRQLLGDKADAKIYPKFNVNALLRGDMVNRTNAIVQQLQYGLLTINEARNLEDRNPIKEEIGDKPLLSHNLRPADEPAPAPAATMPKMEPKKDDAAESKDTENTTDSAAGVRSAAFTPLLENIIGRFVRRAREKKPDDVGKFAAEPLVPAVETLLTVDGKQNAKRAAELAVKIFCDEWNADLKSGTKREESEAQETARRARELIEVCGGMTGLNPSAAPVVNVSVAPPVVELHSEPAKKKVCRLKWINTANGREAVISEE